MYKNADQNVLKCWSKCTHNWHWLSLTSRDNPFIINFDNSFLARSSFKIQIKKLKILSRHFFLISRIQQSYLTNKIFGFSITFFPQVAIIKLYFTHFSKVYMLLLIPQVLKYNCNRQRFISQVYLYFKIIRFLLIYFVKLQMYNLLCLFVQLMHKIALQNYVLLGDSNGVYPISLPWKRRQENSISWRRSYLVRMLTWNKL